MVKKITFDQPGSQLNIHKDQNWPHKLGIKAWLCDCCCDVENLKLLVLCTLCASEFVLSFFSSSIWILWHSMCFLLHFFFFLITFDIINRE